MSIKNGFGTPEVSTTIYDYNNFGQAVEVINPNNHATKFSYHSSGPLRGYLKEVETALMKTTVEPDDRGNQTAIENARGVRSEMVYSELDQLMEVTEAVTGSTDGAPALSYSTRFLYDGNGNLAEQKTPYGAGTGHTKTLLSKIIPV